MKAYPYRGVRLQGVVFSLWAAASLLHLRAADVAAPDTPSWTLITREADNNTWQSVRTVTDSRTGREFQRTNTIQEIASGLNYLDGQGSWQPSSEVIEIFAGGARAIQGQTKVTFPANLNVQEALNVTFKNGEHFVTTPLGISYTDLATGQSIWLAEIQDCQGQIHAPKTVVYADAFDTLKADVHYVYERDRVEAFISILENPAPPETYNLDPATTVLDCWTEVYSAPASTKQTRTLPDGLIDESFNLGGQMQIGAGKAFLLGAGPDSPQAANVAKTWVTAQGRSFIVESVRYPSVQAQLQTLPPAQQQAAVGKQPVFNRQALRLPPQRQARLNNPKPLQMASLPINKSGLAIDWTGITSTLNNYTFLASETYAVSANVNLDGTNTFEGGCVIKFADSASLTARGPVVCANSPYRFTVMTSWHDDRVGEILPGSTGTPTNRLADPALKLDTVAAGASFNLQYFRILHAKKGIYLYNGTTNVLRHMQFVNCGSSLYFDTANAIVRNALFVNTDAVFGGTGTCTARVEHATVDQAGFLVSTNWTGTNKVWLTNSVLVLVTNFGPGYFTNESVCVVHTNSSVFQSLGTAAHYLTNGTALRDTGTTNINATLAGELRKQTTYAPVTVTGNLTGDLWLMPVTPRDNDPPDPGYHYDVVDYAINQVAHSNGVASVSSGTVLAAYSQTSSGEYGWVSQSGAQLLVEGTPDQPARIVALQTVQEPSRTNWNWKVTPIVSAAWTPDPIAPVSRFRFVDWSSLAMDSMLWQAVGDPPLTNSTLVMRDNQFHGGEIYWDSLNLALTNCLFDRTKVLVSDNAGWFFHTNTSINLALNNNTFTGFIELNNFSGTATWWVRNNLFGTTDVYGTNSLLTHGYNGYITGSPRFAPHLSTDVTNLVINWQTGPLGRLYHVGNSSLTNVGSTYATNIGLYHFTISTNLVREGTTIVDIGFHYVVTDANGSPTDTDGDGIPDWLEDANGNGVIDGNEGDPNNIADTGFRVVITRPRNGSHIP